MPLAQRMERSTPATDPADEALASALRAASRSSHATPPDPSERPLIERAQRGDAQAFRELVERHQQRAFRIARHMTPNDEDARDLVQEAFLRVFRSLERFDFQYSFSTWLHRIVTNLAIDHLRKRRTQAAGRATESDGVASDVEQFDPADSRGASPAARLEVQETARAVRECIAALAPHFQSVLLLREIEGLPCNEIAKIVGATHVTVRWRLHRGRKLFQEEWERRERALASGAAQSSGAASADPSPRPGEFRQ